MTGGKIRQGGQGGRGPDAARPGRAESALNAEIARITKEQNSGALSDTEAGERTSDADERESEAIEKCHEIGE